MDSYAWQRFEYEEVVHSSFCIKFDSACCRRATETQMARETNQNDNKNTERVAQAEEASGKTNNKKKVVFRRRTTREPPVNHP